MATTALLSDAGPLADRLSAALAAAGVEHRRLAPGDATGAALTPFRAALYLPSRFPVPTPAATAPLLDALAAVERAVVMTSSEIYPPHHHNPGFAAEDQPALKPDRHPVSQAWADFETAVRRRLADATALVLLRAAPVPVAGGDDPWSRLLSGRLAATLPGYDPSLQLLAVDDLAAALARALDADAAGVYNVVPAGTVPLRAALRLAGVRRLPLPAWLLRPLAGRRGAWVDYRRHPWTAGGERATAELGFTAERSSAAAVGELAAQRGRWTRHVRATALPAGEPAEPDRRRHPARSVRFDRFGMDPHYIAVFGRTLFPFLHDVYWRVEHRGLEHLPRHGRAVLTGVHRGFQPWDGVMTLHLLVRETGRYPRFLLHPTLLKFPFLFNYMTKLGGVPACRENADRILGDDGLLAIYPEGIRGAFTPYRRAYRLGRFGRDDYVRMAIANRAPIVPFVTVGSAEIYPILGRVDWSWFKRFSEWPYLPLTPTFPWLPVPLPSKWHTRFLPPVHVEREHPPEAAEDRELVRRVSREVRRTLQGAIDELVERRPSIWWGSAFDGGAAADEVTDVVTDEATASRLGRLS